eukprot:6802071-Lingulodinium_polyedra.AAC.1
MFGRGGREALYPKVPKVPKYVLEAEVVRRRYPREFQGPNVQEELHFRVLGRRGWFRVPKYWNFRKQ